ncbi:alpha/beta hydrolase [Nonomuraea longicatena]|uniref:DUF1023 domain-containing protein n=1 Tax=Nonomuraea longicatena TaxID=83682 RepID=A0ABN1NS62_9ACTN
MSPLASYHRLAALVAEHAADLDAAARLAAAHAWVGGGAPHFAAALATHRASVRSALTAALSTAADELTRRGEPADPPADAAHTDDAPAHTVAPPPGSAATALTPTAAHGPVRGVDVRAMTSLIASLDAAALRLARAGTRLRTELTALSLPASPAWTLSRAGEWSATQTPDLRRRLARIRRRHGWIVPAGTIAYELFAGHAAPVGSLLTRLSSGDADALGQLLTLRDSALPVRVHAWWRTLSPAQRRRLVEQAGFGLLNGLPAAVRDRANRHFLAAEKFRLLMALTEPNPVDAADPWADPSASLPLKDTSASPASGDLDAPLALDEPAVPAALEDLSASLASGDLNASFTLAELAALLAAEDPSFTLDDPSLGWDAPLFATEGPVSPSAAEGPVSPFTAADLIDVSQEQIVRDLGALAEVEHALAGGGTPGNPPAYLLAFSLFAGRVIVSWGDPDSADITATYVPGLDTALGGIAGGIDRARALRAQAQATAGARQVAAIALLGCDAPPPEDIWEPGDTMAEDAMAAWSAAELAAFADGLAAAGANEREHVVIGHGRGSLVVGKAALLRPGRLADDLVFVGSAEVGVEHAADLGVPEERVWVGEDPETGPDTAAAFGAGRFPADGALSREAWTPGSAPLARLGLIVTGDGTSAPEPQRLTPIDRAKG